MGILDEYPPLALGLRTTQLIVFALFLGVVAFLAIASFMVATGRVERIEPPILTWVLLGVGVAMLPVVLLVRRVVIGAARKAVRVGLGPTPGRGAPDVSEAGAAGRLFQGWQAGTITLAAGLEGVALLAAVGALLEGHMVGVVGGGMFALLLLAFVPTRDRLEGWLEQELRDLRAAPPTSGRSPE